MAVGSGEYLTTNLYAKMQSEGKFRDAFPSIPPAGRSITVPLNDSTERDLQSEVYFPLPETPLHERRFRRLSQGPGEITVFHSLKEQKLPGEDFRYGIRGIRGSSTEDAMKAGLLLGVAEYRNSVAEQVYDSTKREPIGKPYIRGHTIKMLPQGFGNASDPAAGAKPAIFPVHMKPDSEEVKAMYRKTHNCFAPGEQTHRGYLWPAETQAPSFRFGMGLADAVSGAGARAVLNWDVDDEGNLKKTRMVQKVCEDYRDVDHYPLSKKRHMKQGAYGPPLPEEHRFGIKSSISDYTAKTCIQGYYALEDQLPDQDLGRCTKPGRRNVTTETRAFGVPSVRTDIPAPPPSKRSIAANMSYGDECSAAAVLNPQRFDARNVPDRDFLVRRPKDELRALVRSGMPGVDFEQLWTEALDLFDDDLPLVSLDALLYLQSGKIEQQVARSLSMPKLTA